MGNKLYAQGGWITSGSASVAFIGAALVMCFANGPWNKGWIGWGTHVRNHSSPFSTVFGLIRYFTSICSREMFRDSRSNSERVILTAKL